MPPDTQKPEGRDWRVEFHPAVARRIAKIGLRSADFSPALFEVIARLEEDPTDNRRFPQKKGTLAGIRAASLRYRSAE